MEEPWWIEKWERMRRDHFSCQIGFNSCWKGADSYQYFIPSQKKMNDIKNTFFISCIHSFQTEEKALLFLLIAMSSVKQSGAFFPSPDSCFAMLRKLQKILTRLFGKPHNNVIASQYKYRTKIHLPIFITRSLWIKHV